MSEMDNRGVTCGEVRDLGAELALGVLPGRERARVLSHLDRCPDCREYVEQLTLVSDGLLELLPGSEPPVGFEKRVMNRLGLSGRRQPRWARFRVMVAAAAAALTIAGGFGGWGISSALEGTSAPATVASSLLETGLSTPGGHQVGRIFAYHGSPGWVYMSVHAPMGSGKVTCRLVRADGSTRSVGTFELRNGHGYWGGPADVNPKTLSGARLVNADGSVLATAHF